MEHIPGHVHRGHRDLHDLQDLQDLILAPFSIIMSYLKMLSAGVWSLLEFLKYILVCKLPLAQNKFQEFLLQYSQKVNF